MRKRNHFLVLVGVIASPLGCNSSHSPRVSYEFRNDSERGGGSQGVVQSGSFTAGKNKLELREGSVFANGKDYGTVQEGDSVLLAKKGKLSVNGKERSTK
jgi:hypothetical protein